MFLLIISQEIKNKNGVNMAEDDEDEEYDDWDDEEEDYEEDEDGTEEDEDDEE
jgi:hypothetical protein